MRRDDCNDAGHEKTAFCFFLDKERYGTHQAAVTPQQIRDIVGNISGEVPIVLCLDDGTQRTLQESEEVPLEKCRNFKRLPRFKRG